MKKVLVTGASGAIGVNVIKYLLSEGKYEITALDLRNKNSQKKLKRYRRRINLVYGDINDGVLIDSLIKGHDYVIHLAGVMPPLADIKKSMGESIDYNGTKKIVGAIKNYNPKCFLIYASTTTLYGNVLEASVTSKTKINDLDYYASTKYRVEKLIAKELEYYTIFRLPFVLCNPASNAFVYQIRKNQVIEAITDNDAGYLFASAISHKEKLNKQIFNASGGEEMRDTYRHILARVLGIYGLSVRYFLCVLFLDKNFYSPFILDSDKLEDILEFRSDSISSYYMRLKRQVKGRFISKLFAKPLVWILKRK